MLDGLPVIALGVGAALVWVGLPLVVMVGLGAAVWKFARC
jgi:hypothetical protein